MVEGNPDVTLDTLHGDLADLKGEMRAGFADLKGEMRTGFADLKATVVAGFATMPTRDQSDEMVRLLREGNRLQEERFTQLDGSLRAQHLETQQVLRALADSQRLVIETQRGLADGQHLLVEEQRRLSVEVRSLSGAIKALVARIDALIRGRDNGEPRA